MEKKDYSISMLKAQTASLPFGFIAVAEVFVFGFLHGFRTIGDGLDILLPWYFIPIFLVGIVLHELIHGVAWKFAANIPFSQITFGFQWKTITPYAHCKIPIPKRAYVIGTAMPAVVLGIVPFIISLANGSGWMLIIGVLFTFAAVGDFLIIYLIRTVPWNVLVEDHPTNAGCFVYENGEIDSRV
jgi:hypothetical protein